MPNANAAPLTTMGGYRKRKQDAKDRAETRIAPPDVRAARATVLERREAAMTADNKAVAQKANRPAEVYRETLALVPDDLLHEMQRGLSTLSTRQMADIVSDVLTGRRRPRKAADFAVGAPDAPTPATARKPAKAA